MAISIHYLKCIYPVCGKKQEQQKTKTNQGLCPPTFVNPQIINMELFTQASVSQITFS